MLKPIRVTLIIGTTIYFAATMSMPSNAQRGYYKAPPVVVPPPLIVGPLIAPSVITPVLPHIITPRIVLPPPARQFKKSPCARVVPVEKLKCKGGVCKKVKDFKCIEGFVPMN